MLAREKLAAGSAHTGNNLLFLDVLGRRMTPMSTTNAISRLARKAGISTTRLHAMRHTAATTMLAAGVDLQSVSSIVGHANASTTLNIYNHMLPKIRNVAINMLGDQLERAINGDSEEPQNRACTRRPT